jgi:eukaryotic-like serine/threonine-protein kinase
VVALLASIPVGPAALAQSSGPEWSQLQGNGSHAGVASPPVNPPLRVAWRFRPAGPGDRGLSAVALGGGFAVVNRRNQVIAFDPATGSTRWTHPRTAGSLSTPAIAPNAGAHGVVVTSQGLGADSAVIGLDLSSGAALWSFKVKQPVVASPAIDGDLVFVGGEDHFLDALDVATGVLKWRKAMPAPILAAPAVADGRVFAVSEDSTTGAIRLAAFDAASGMQRWSFAPPSPGLGSSAPVVAGDRVFVGFGDETVRALDVRTGAERWSAPVRSAFSPATSPAADGRGVYIADDHGAAYRFDARSGARVWDFQFDALENGSAPLIDGGFVLLGLDDGSVAAIDLASGDLRWRLDLGVGTVAALSPAGDLILAPLRDSAGGVVALRSDPSGKLVRIESPTVLHVGQALVNFVLAFVALLAVVLGLVRFLPGGRPPRSAGEAAPALDGEVT